MTFSPDEQDCKPSPSALHPFLLGCSSLDTQFRGTVQGGYKKHTSCVWLIHVADKYSTRLNVPISPNTRESILLANKWSIRGQGVTSLNPEKAWPLILQICHVHVSWLPWNAVSSIPVFFFFSLDSLSCQLLSLERFFFLFCYYFVWLPFMSSYSLSAVISVGLNQGHTAVLQQIRTGVWKINSGSVGYAVCSYPAACIIKSDFMYLMTFRSRYKTYVNISFCILNQTG